jgi:mannosyl-glycoprotein endo-beta-N-acetylglucosaminidase
VPCRDRYDAVTTEGRLDWQDALTPLNAPFFDVADALFLNYT